ncbi:MAG: TlpA family protein disulfide reductase [Phycisphaerae bacterium]|nr:TlpA family protein disulfide reductase [Phycisphaerae bacterium]
MSILRTLTGVLLVAALSATATAQAGVPDEVIKNIEALFLRPRERLTGEQLKKLYIERMEKVLKLGAEAESKYPKAENLHIIRDRMLRAASGLVSVKGDAASRKTMLDVAGRIMASEAPVEAKVEADAAITAEKVKPDTTKTTPAQKEKEIRAMVKRYAGTKAEVRALLYGASMARDTKLADLLTELADTLEKKHLNLNGIRDFLRKLGRKLPFTAKLTRLDGSALALPKDLLGKVLVIDFWATWCGPCIREIPHMKKVYAEYSSKGVEFVGISLDRAGSKDKLAKFVKARQMNWIHTFSGKGWSDPTAKAYGVRAIPSIWVIGKDGKIVSSNARGNLEATIEKALKSPKSSK